MLTLKRWKGASRPSNDTNVAPILLRLRSEHEVALMSQGHTEVVVKNTRTVEHLPSQRNKLRQRVNRVRSINDLDGRALRLIARQFRYAISVHTCHDSREDCTIRIIDTGSTRFNHWVCRPDAFNAED